MMRISGWLLATLLFLCAPVRSDDSLAPAPNAVRALMVGAEVPDVTLMDASGAAFDLRTEVAKRPVIAVFYRGHW